MYSSGGCGSHACRAKKRVDRPSDAVEAVGSRRGPGRPRRAQEKLYGSAEAVPKMSAAAEGAGASAAPWRAPALARRRPSALSSLGGRCSVLASMRPPPPAPSLGGLDSSSSMPPPVPNTPPLSASVVADMEAKRVFFCPPLFSASWLAAAVRTFGVRLPWSAMHGTTLAQTNPDAAAKFPKALPKCYTRWT